MVSFTNRTYDEIEVGATISVSRRLSRTDVETLAFVSGDVDPFHLEESEAGREIGRASCRERVFRTV